jgi:GT2 family glycosyltransferase
MRRRAVRQIGQLDDNLFAYGEDNDYCRRVLRRGYTIGVAKGVYVHHEHHATTGSLFRDGWIDERKAEARRYLQKKYEGLTETDEVGPLWQGIETE